MSRILCVWELGGGYGHMGPFLPLALQLRERGHEVSFALRDLSRAETILGRNGFPLLQAPLWLPKVEGLPDPPLSYAEILHRFGFLDKAGLTGMVKAWRKLFELVRPNLLLIDHGPTALLASLGTGIPRTLIGNGFSSPPRISPMPNMRPWMNVPQQRLMESEQIVVANINKVLADLGTPSIRILADLFRVEEDFLCTFPELDHYPNRGGARYWGPLFPIDKGVEPQWPSRGDKKIFAYLRSTYPDFEKLLGQLRALPFQTLVHVTNISPQIIKTYQSENLCFSPEPVSLSRTLKEADLVICHAGHGTISAALLIGRPLLLLPGPLEEYLTALNVTKMVAGLMVHPERRNDDDGGMIKRLLTERSFAERAQAFAKKYVHFNQAGQIKSIVKRCEEILGLVTLQIQGVGA